MYPPASQSDSSSGGSVPPPPQIGQKHCWAVESLGNCILLPVLGSYRPLVEPEAGLLKSISIGSSPPFLNSIFHHQRSTPTSISAVPFQSQGNYRLHLPSSTPSSLGIAFSATSSPQQPLGGPNR